MEKNTHSLNWLALGAELIDCLRSKRQSSSYKIRCLRLDDGTHTKRSCREGCGRSCHKHGTLFRFLQTPCGRLELGASYRSIIYRRTYGFVGHRF